MGPPGRPSPSTTTTATTSKKLRKSRWTNNTHQSNGTPPQPPNHHATRKRPCNGKLYYSSTKRLKPSPTTDPLRTERRSTQPWQIPKPIQQTRQHTTDPTLPHTITIRHVNRRSKENLQRNEPVYRRRNRHRKTTKALEVNRFIQTFHKHQKNHAVNLIYRERSSIWRNFGFIPNTSISIHKNAQIIKQQLHDIHVTDSTQQNHPPHPCLTLTQLPPLKSITTNPLIEHVIISVQDRSNHHPARPNYSVLASTTASKHQNHHKHRNPRQL